MGAQMAADHDVFQRAHVGEQAYVLKCARNAGLRQQVRFSLRPGFAGEGKAAAVELIQAGEDIEQRGFARAIGADEAVDFALFDMQRDAG